MLPKLIHKQRSTNREQGTLTITRSYQYSTRNRYSCIPNATNEDGNSTLTTSNQTDDVSLKCVVGWEGIVSHLEVNTEVMAHGLGGCNTKKHKNESGTRRSTHHTAHHYGIRFAGNLHLVGLVGSAEYFTWNKEQESHRPVRTEPNHGKHAEKDVSHHGCCRQGDLDAAMRAAAAAAAATGEEREPRNERTAYIGARNQGQKP
jgi:hypothetical protein